MKTTQYFKFRRRLPDRAEIQDAWIDEFLRHPSKTQTQSDGRIRMWAKIKEAGGRYLRVVLLEDAENGA